MEEHSTFYLEFIKAWMVMFINMSHISNNLEPERLDNKQFAPPIHPRFGMFHGKKKWPQVINLLSPKKKRAKGATRTPDKAC